MPMPNVSDEKLAAITEDVKSRLYSSDEIIVRRQCGSGTVAKVRRQLKAEGLDVSLLRRNTLPDITESMKPAVPETDHQQLLRKALKKGPKTAEELADILDCGPSKVRALVESMQLGGSMLASRKDGLIQLLEGVHIEPATTVFKGVVGTQRFGLVSDNHLCNKHSRLDVLNAAYDHFEREGIAVVYNGGNWIDGEARFNKTELITRPGMDAQCDYMIDKYPIRKGIETQYIAGDDHEGWYQQREGVEIGRYLELRAREQGRTDLKYLGYGEHDIKLQVKGGGSAPMRLVHPGGGSSYATSYTAQKLVESYQGGEKPKVLLIGHYHKFEYGYPREVHALQLGCTTDQSLFMRKLKFQAHVGYSVVSITQDETGTVTRFAVEFFPFYNLALYEKRF